jgi:hypothetical protein
VQRPRSSTTGLSGAAIALLGFVAACSAPQYDDQTDKLISQLQTDVDTQIVALITLDHKIALLTRQTDAAARTSLTDATTKAGYDASTGFYDKIDVDLTTLQTRVDAEPTPATPAMDRSIKDLHDNLLDAPGSLQVTHQAVEVLSEGYLRSVRTLIDTQIGALLTRELGLKNGSPTVGAAAPATSK